MKHKKNERKKKVSTPSLSKDQEALVTSLLNEFTKAAPKGIVAQIPSPACAKTFIDRLPLNGQTSIPLLRAINEAFDDKQVKKAIKRGLFRLKSKGISTEGFSTEDAPAKIFKPGQNEEPACCLGPIDTVGSRAVIVHFHQSGQGIDVGMGMVSDEQGIQEFLFDQMSRKRACELKLELARMAGPLVEVSLSHAAMILEDAFQRANTPNPEPRSNYLRLRPWLLENAPALEHSAIFHSLPVSNKEHSRTDLQWLFEHHLLKSWLLPFDPLKPFMVEIHGVHHTPLILSETQKLNRVLEIKEKCIRSLFPASKREQFKKRLKEMAFFFSKSGQKEYAEICHGAASGIYEEESRFTQQPVLEFFIERSIEHYAAMGEQQSKENQAPANPSISESPPGILLP